MLKVKDFFTVCLPALLIQLIVLNGLAAQDSDAYVKSFSSSHIPQRGVQLVWSTKYNDTTAYFIVERSLDGQNFEEIGEVSSINTKTSYKFIDRKPYAEVSYYRIAVIDYDGNVFKSNLTSVYLPATNKPELVLYPMPVGNSNALNLNFLGIENSFKALVTITDQFGRQVLSKEMELSSMQNNSTLDLNGVLSPGSYQLTVLGHSGQSFKIGKLLQIIE